MSVRIWGESFYVGRRRCVSVKGMGIYEIVNTENHKRYIGSSVNLSKRLTDHKRDLGYNRHPNKYLQNSWNKHGADKFFFNVIENVKNREDLLNREQYWMDLFTSYESNSGYNILKTAKNSMLGFKHSEETKEKIRRAKLGTTHSEESKAKMSRPGELNSFYGKTHTQESLSKMRGRKVSASHKKKLSLLRRGEGSPTARLTEEEVKEIKHLVYYDNASDDELSQTYNVSKATIGRIRAGKNWSFVESDLQLTKIDRLQEFRDSQSGEGNYAAKLKTEDVIEIKKMLSEALLTQKEIGKMFNVTGDTIGHIKRGNTWKHVQI